MIAISLAVLITIIGVFVLQSAIAQTTESQAQYTPGEIEGFEAATSRATADEANLKEQQASSLPETSLEEASMIAPPANDNWANAQTIVGTNEFAVGTNVEATIEAGEPNVQTVNKTVWYKWTAPSNLSMTFGTYSGTLTDTIIGVYTGAAVNSLTTIAFNDDINGAQNRKSRVTFIANSGTNYYIQMLGFSTLDGTFTLGYEINAAETRKQFNFDGGIGSENSDYAVFRPSNGYWYIRLSNSGSMLAQPWGLNTDIIHPGDFDGDGGTDIGVWRPSNGTFYVLRSIDSALLAVQWGQTDDFPVQGDFDGDDKADFAVWRPSNGTFYVRRSTDGQLLFRQFGQAGDFVSCGDYDGDGKTDFGVRRNVAGSGVFYYLRSSDNQVIGQQFGFGTDLVVPGDYDGDGKHDIAVYRESTNVFYALRSTDGGLFALQWGTAGDIIAPGNYVDNTRTDVTVFRPSTGTFYSYNAANGALSFMQWGTNGDVPIARSNVH